MLSGVEGSLIEYVPLSNVLISHAALCLPPQNSNSSYCLAQLPARLPQSLERVRVHSRPRPRGLHLKTGARMEAKPSWAAGQAEGEGEEESPPMAGPGTSFIEPPLPPPLQPEISALQWAP